MNIRFQTVILVVVTGMALLSLGCPLGDDGTIITLKNQTSIPVKVDISWVTQESTNLPSVLPYETNKNRILMPGVIDGIGTGIEPQREQGIDFKYYITVITEAGELWQKVFTWDELDKMDWTITIELR